MVTKLTTLSKRKPLIELGVNEVRPLTTLSTGVKRRIADNNDDKITQKSTSQGGGSGKVKNINSSPISNHANFLNLAGKVVRTQTPSSLSTNAKV